MERTFPVHSPKIERIEVAARGDVRRAKLYYLRDRVGRGARVRERRWTGALEEETFEAGAMPPDDAPRPGEDELGEARAEADEAEAAEAAEAEAPRATPPRPRRRPTPWRSPTPSPWPRRTRAPATRPRRRTKPTGIPRTSPRARPGRAESWRAQRRRAPAGLSVELVTIVAVALGLALGIQAFLVKPFRIPSESMVPTLEVGQRVLVDRVSFRFSDPDRGDIVVFKPPAGADSNTRTEHPPDSPCPRPTPGQSDTNFIKRGGRGRRPLKVINGAVYIDGKRQREPYARLDASCGLSATCPRRSRSPRLLLHDGRQPRRVRGQPCGGRSRRTR